MCIRDRFPGVEFLCEYAFNYEAVKIEAGEGYGQIDIFHGAPDRAARFNYISRFGRGAELHQGGIAAEHLCAAPVSYTHLGCLKDIRL